MELEWDEAKNTANIEKHGIDFNNAHEIFSENRLIFLDVRNDYGEERFVAVGWIRSRLMVLIYTQRPPEVIRVISLRKANNREKDRFEKTIKN